MIKFNDKIILEVNFSYLTKYEQSRQWLYKCAVFSCKDLVWLELEVHKNVIKQQRGRILPTWVGQQRGATQNDAKWILLQLHVWVLQGCAGFRWGTCRACATIRIATAVPRKQIKTLQGNVILVLCLTHQEAEKIRHGKEQHFQESCSRRRFWQSSLAN